MLKIDVVKDGQPLSAKLCQYYGLDGRDFKISYDAVTGRNLSFANCYYTSECHPGKEKTGMALSFAKYGACTYSGRLQLKNLR